MKTPLALALCAALAAGCAGGDGASRQDTTTARRPPVLAGVPLYTGSRVLDTTGTSDAAMLTVSVPARPDSVAAFYRRELVGGGWRIVGDRQEDGGVDLFAERDGPPLWVQVRPGRLVGSSRVTLIGAVGGAAPRGDSVR